MPNIYIFHGTDDEVIPYESAKKLYNSIPQKNKKLYTIEGAGHNYLQDFDIFKKGMANALD
ncbi:MAG: hypothetical protein HKN31_07115 [Pricia sp.]|nr:hypothetical protein [Pricia sp.]